MSDVFLGKDSSERDFRIPIEAFSTHFHLIGGTGKGKTTAIHTMLQPLMMSRHDRACFFMIDRLGNFSQEMLLWMASRFCPQHVRDRLVYIQPSREDIVPAFNPLLYETRTHGYYKVERATEIILRAWESMNIEAMPRLARWIFNSFWAAAQLGLTISDCVHFLMPGSTYHEPLLRLLPDSLQAEWREITGARGGEASRILDSSRNRLKPYFESDILRRMFGASESKLDILRLMREGRIVLIDLAPRNRLSGQLANTIGGLIINEILAVARSLPREVTHQTYLLLDEFQNFVGPDIEAALPEVRQLGLRLILSHQSFSQLRRKEYDLTNMIFQAQSRMIFGVQGEDAEILAQEVASLTYDPNRVKDEIWSWRQLNDGFGISRLRSGSKTKSSNRQWGESNSSSDGRSEGLSWRDHLSYEPIHNESQTKGDSFSRSTGGSEGDSSTNGWHETMVPKFNTFRELSSRTYVSFEEQRNIWARNIRQLRRGQALIRLVDDPNLHVVDVERSAAGFLEYDVQTIARKFPKAFERVDELVEQNFRSDFFLPADQVDTEIDQRIERLISGEISSRPPKNEDDGSVFSA